MDLDPGDGNFQKGNKAKLIGVVAVVAALAGGVAFALNSSPAELEMTVADAATEMKDIFVMPKDQQIAAWRKWAGTPGDSGGVTWCR